jgi:hypothetical protein
LQQKGLIELKGGLEVDEQLDAVKVEQLSRDYKAKFPGFPETDSGGEGIAWKLKTPLPVGAKGLPHLMWSLSETGSQAVELIIKAVSKQLLQSEPAQSK